MRCIILMLILSITGVYNYPSVISKFDESSSQWSSRLKRVKKELALISDGSPSSANSASGRSLILDNKLKDDDNKMKPIVASQERKMEKLGVELSANDLDERGSGTNEELDVDDIVRLKQRDIKANEAVDLTMLAKPVSKLRRISRDTEGVLNVSKIVDNLIREQDKKPSNNSRDTAVHSSLKSINENSTMEIDIPHVKTEADFIDYMLTEAQNRLLEIRLYFEKICRKHHPDHIASNIFRQFNIKELLNTL
ncbi:uncharacterized protein [Prorops nasuta]|uniref:uncharacterized protein n=1 Tax=Prorops nasuta TaxID=863751 RepID=UPI0034CFF408